MVKKGIFNHGDVVYFVNNDLVSVGIFDEMIEDQGYAYVDLVELADHRYINDIPIQEFHSETEWHKLPDGWNYDTELFREEVIIPKWEAERRKELFWNRKEDVKAALKEGVIVFSKTVFHGTIEAEVDCHLGYRIIKRYPHWSLTYGQQNREYRRVKRCDLFLTFDGAFFMLQQIQRTRRMISSMSDEEFNLMGIKNVLNKVDSRYAEQCMRFLCSLPDLSDIEVKRLKGKVYWRRFARRTEWEEIPGGSL